MNPVPHVLPIRKLFRLALSIFVGSLFISQSQAVYWDSNGSAPGLGNGAVTGIWSTSSAFWNPDFTSWNTTTPVGWTNGSIATFDHHTSYNITVSGTVVVSRLNLGRDPSTLSGGTIDFGSGAAEFYVLAGESEAANVSSTLTGAGSLTFVGDVPNYSYLNLTGASTFAGGANVAMGIKTYTGSGASLSTGAAGDVIVSGASSGNYATLNFSNGADFNAGQHVLVGGDNGTGFLNLTGAGADGDVTGHAWFGNLAGTAGYLDVSGGATFDVGTSFSLADVAGSYGYATIRGAGSELNLGLNSDSNLYVGYAGIGGLTIENGASVTTHASTPDSSHLLVAVEAGSTGSLTVTGPGSTLDVDGHLWTGGGDGSSATTASVTISDGGSVTVASSVSIADQTGATDTLLVTGTGSTLEVGTNLFVGYLGDGEASFDSGAQAMIAGELQVGAANSASGPGHGELTVDGANTLVRVLNTISAGTGENASGSIEISNSGILSGDRGLLLGSQPGSTGTLTIRSGGSLHISDFEGTDGIRSGSGSASLTLDGGIITVSKTDGVGDPVAATLSTSVPIILASDSRIDTSDNTAAFSGEISGNGGLTKQGVGTLTLSGSNTYSGGTVVSSGTLALAHNDAVGTAEVLVDGGVFLIQEGFAPSNAITLAGGSVAREFGTSADLTNAINATSSLAGGTDTTVSILSGTTSASTILTGSFAATSGADNDGIRLSDVFSLSGVPVVNILAGETDIFVLQLEVVDVNGSSFLGWLDPGTNAWVNATDGNFGGTALFRGDGAYNPGTEFVLGYYGVDTANNTVWAVLNHNSEFGVVPEPSTAMLVLAAVGSALIQRRRKRTV